MRARPRLRMALRIAALLLIINIGSVLIGGVRLTDQQHKLEVAVRRTMPHFCPDQLEIFTTLIGCRRNGVYAIYNYSAARCEISAENLMWSSDDLISATGEVQTLPIKVTPCAF